MVFASSSSACHTARVYFMRCCIWTGYRRYSRILSSVGSHWWDSIINSFLWYSFCRNPIPSLFVDVLHIWPSQHGWIYNLCYLWMHLAGILQRHCSVCGRLYSISFLIKSVHRNELQTLLLVPSINKIYFLCLKVPHWEAWEPHQCLRPGLYLRVSTCCMPDWCCDLHVRVIF